MALGIPPGTEAANRQNLSIANQRLHQLDTLEQKVDQKLADPAYSRAGRQAELNDVRSKMENAKQALKYEKSVREDLDAHLTSANEAAAQTDLNQLNQLRGSTYPQYYHNGARVGDPCIPCLTKAMNRVRPALMPTSDEEAAYAITGSFEGGNYCSLADNPDDAGKLSYGKYQASETSGNLHDLLQRYSNSTEPEPDPDLKQKMDDQLTQFSEDGKTYEGTAAQRTALKSLLKEACNDPAMQTTQDQFFQEKFWNPAVQQATKYGVNTPLGKAMYFDMQIQGPGLVDGFSERALQNWSKENDVNPPATACAPDDRSGPDEKTFLYLVDAERRKKMQNSSNAVYKATSYRPDGFDQLLDQDNMDLSQDFTLRGQPVEGIAPRTDSQVSPAP